MFKNFLPYPPSSNVYISPRLPQSMHNVSGFQRQFQRAALRVLLNKVLRALNELPAGCHKNLFNGTNFHRFHEHVLEFHSL